MPEDYGNRKTLELLIDSIEELKEKTDKNNQDIQRLELKMVQLLGEQKEEIIDRLNKNNQDSTKKFGELNLSVEKKMTVVKDGIMECITGYKTEIDKKVNSNDKKVSLLNQKVVLITVVVAFVITTAVNIAVFFLK